MNSNNYYSHFIIEKKWKNYWIKHKEFKADLHSLKPKFYVLDMFPYPSGSGLHVGHPEGYTATDIIARMKRMQGYEVIHPIGWDAFGLPAEQYAIKTGNNPKDFTEENIKNFKSQLISLGFSFDWWKEVNTSDPDYYKWTQWIFAQLYKNDLVELKDIEVNWSSSLNTVLANEEVLKDDDGNYVSERDGKIVEKKLMKQWVLKITKYADRLFNNLDKLDWPEAVKKLQKNWIYEKDDEGKYTKTLHLKDWVFARQRYWGEPFPLIHFENGEIYLIPEEEYPVLLPKIKNYKFSSDGKPALSNAKNWINVTINNKKGKRDLNTMPQWAGSCWYYIAYILKTKDGYLELNSSKAKLLLSKWLPVDLYVGGREHAVLHLMYARFWNMFLYDIGILDVEEPFKKLFNQGMILGPDYQKMSKSKGNVINPNEYIEKYGADTLRVYEMFMGPLESPKPWSNEKIHGIYLWLNRVYRFFTREAFYIPDDKVSRENKKLFNNLLERINDLYPKLKFNVAISEMMIFINGLYKNHEISIEMAIQFLQILSCIAPFVSNEIYSILIKEEKSLSNLIWPKKYNIDNKESYKVILFQVNGKVKNTVKVKEDFNLNDLNDNQIIDFICENVTNICQQKLDRKKIKVIKNRIISINL